MEGVVYYSIYVHLRATSRDYLYFFYQLGIEFFFEKNPPTISLIGYPDIATFILDFSLAKVGEQG